MSTVQLTSESSEPESQFNNGIKMIVSAYETQTNLLSNEISMLNAELEKKNEKIAEMEELCASLLKEKSDFESKIYILNSENAKLNHKIEMLISENKDLKKVKEKIISTIEKNNSKTLEREFSQPNILLYKSKSRSNIRNGSDFDELINNTTVRKTKLVKNTLANSLKKNWNKNLSSMMPINNKQPSQSARSSFSETYSLNSNYGNSSSDFFKKCRCIMQSEEYNKMIEVVRMFNAKKISKEETYRNISDILSKGKYDELIKEFDKLFQFDLYF